MRLLLLGPGSGEIPPTGRGAVEAILWEHATRLRARGHQVDILNVRPSKIPLALPRAMRGKRYDWVWTHHERMVPWARRYAGARHVHLSHRPVTDPDGMDPYGARVLRLGARAKHHFCLTREIMLVNKVLHPSCRVAFAPNGVTVADFRFESKGRGAIYLGGLSKRKRQREVAEAGFAGDFVGPIDREDEDTRHVATLPSYRGAWSRAELHDRLTKYAVLVLYSRAEAQPLVIGEAFAAGLSVVLSPESARNVDAALPFVTIVRTAAELPAAVAAAEARNADLRPLIRAHAEAEWDWAARIEAIERQLLAWSEAIR